MRRTNWNARRKLFASLAVLGIVLIIAAIAQFTGKDRRANPYASSDSRSTTTATVPSPDSASQNRAVFGADPRPQPTDASPIVRRTPVAPAPEDAEPTTRSRTAPLPEQPNKAGIDQFLTRWRDTVTRGDVQGQTSLYAPHVERFFRQRNVSNSEVRKVKAQMMSLYPTVNRYDLSDVRVESNNGTEAVVSFRKEWDMDGRQRFTGAEKQRLRLRRIDGDWKIVGEEETKVYWVKRG